LCVSCVGGDVKGFVVGPWWLWVLAWSGLGAPCVSWVLGAVVCAGDNNLDWVSPWGVGGRVVVLRLSSRGWRAGTVRELAARGGR
jgi:hypothetical protein